MDCQSVAAQPGRLLGLRVAPVPFAAGWWQAHAWQMRLESPGYWNDWRHRVTLKPGLPAILKFSKDLLQWGTCVQAPKILKELVGGSRNQKQGSRCVFRMCLPEATAQSSQACGGGSINPTSEGWQNSALCIRGDVVEHHVSVLVHLCHSAREVSPPHVFFLLTTSRLQLCNLRLVGAVHCIEEAFNIFNQVNVKWVPASRQLQILLVDAHPTDEGSGEPAQSWQGNGHYHLR
eukprot:s780_g13.t1